jgi:hypothetical protein
MKFCYIDESGIGEEPYAVMVGVITDALRMRPTKSDWEALLSVLSKLAGRTISEFHTRDFYAGNTPWRGLTGQMRAQIIDALIDWINSRKHSLVFVAVDKTRWSSEFMSDSRYADLNTVWRFLGLHLVLSLQKHHQHIPKNKGNTVLIFDNEEKERVRFTDLILNPPAWVDSYYSRTSKQESFDQIVDAPYFADSTDVPLLQVADFLAYFLRRYAELENGDHERYNGERQKVAKWVNKAFARTITKSATYPKRERCDCANLFFEFAPSCLRE